MFLSCCFNRPMIQLPRYIDQNFVNTSFVFHRFVQTKTTSCRRNNPAETFFVVERDATDVRLRVVDLLAGDDGIRRNFTISASNPCHAARTISEWRPDRVVSRATFCLRTIGGHRWSTCHWNLNFEKLICLSKKFYVFNELCSHVHC